MPVVALLLSLALGMERFTASALSSWLKLGGVLLSVVGAVLVVALSASSSTSAIASESKNLPLGEGFLILQILMGGSYPVLQKAVLGRYPALVTAAWGYVLGTGLLALSVITSATDAADWDVDAAAAGAIAYAVVLSSALNYSLMAWVNQVTSPLLLTAFFPFQSVAAVALSALVLGQPADSSDYIGGSLVLLGLIAVVAGKHRESKEGAAATVATGVNGLGRAGAVGARVVRVAGEEGEDDEEESVALRTADGSAAGGLGRYDRLGSADTDAEKDAAVKALGNAVSGAVAHGSVALVGPSSQVGPSSINSRKAGIMGGGVRR
jgi:hypothetical protein